MSKPSVASVNTLTIGSSQTSPAAVAVNMNNTYTPRRGKHGGATTEREQLNKLYELHIEEKLEASPYADVDTEQLKSLSCIQLENIGVDIDHCDCASNATFFQPSRPIDDGLKQILSRDWFEPGQGQASRIYPEYKAGWFTGPWNTANSLKRDELEIDRFGGSAWRTMEDWWLIRETTGLVLPRGFIHLTPGSYDYLHEYFSEFAFFPSDEKKPHLACIVCDTLVSPDMILRSEVHGAVALIKYQLAIKRFSDHRIKPVILYTFQSDEYARITQAYYDPDMGKIVLRQSRQLDLRGPKPTEDAWLLMRWMLNTPVGDTLIKSKDGGLHVRAKEPAASPRKPTASATA